MKKFITTTTVILVGFIALSFTSLETIIKEVKIEQSKVIWKGYKVTGSHEGTIAIQSGTLKFEADELVGGDFVIDMTSITNADLQGENKDKLEGHLKSDDFFGVEKFPTATLVFKNVEAVGKNSYKVTGDLTIKGKTNEITFDMSVYGSKANATLKIDRSKYDVKYGSSSFFDNLKDKVIYDEFDLISDLEF